jgi:hypothetical protein
LTVSYIEIALNDPILEHGSWVSEHKRCLPYTILPPITPESPTHNIQNTFTSITPPPPSRHHKPPTMLATNPKKAATVLAATAVNAVAEEVESPQHPVAPIAVTQYTQGTLQEPGEDAHP